jgi:hypothetical protein
VIGAAYWPPEGELGASQRREELLLSMDATSPDLLVPPRLKRNSIDRAPTHTSDVFLGWRHGQVTRKNGQMRHSGSHCGPHNIERGKILTRESQTIYTIWRTCTKSRVCGASICARTLANAQKWRQQKITYGHSITYMSRARSQNYFRSY